MEDGGEYLVPGRVCLTLGELSSEAEIEEASVTLERSLPRVRGELFSGEVLSPFLGCVEKGMCVHRKCVYDGTVRMGFLELEHIRGGTCSFLEVYRGAFNVLRAWRSERCVAPEQRISASQQLRAQK